MKWQVYIVKCSDGSYYTGITKDLSNRIKVHNLGKGAKYTKGRTPVNLVYKEDASSKSDSLKREIDIKKLTREEKEILINRADLTPT